MSKEVTGKDGHQYMQASSHANPRLNRLIDSDISTPCSIWDQYKKSRTSWGINVLGSFLVEIEATDGTVGFATGFGGKSTQTNIVIHLESKDGR